MSAESYYTKGQSKQGANEALLQKGNAGYTAQTTHCGLGTDNNSPEWRSPVLYNQKPKLQLPKALSLSHY